MSNFDDLLNEVKFLIAARSFSYTSTSDACDVYEGFVFSLVVSTASKWGAQVRYEDVHGNTVQDLLFRTGPGQLYQKTKPFTHAVIEFDRAPALEAHVGVRIQGGSGVLHECDVVVLQADEAALSRREGIAPRGTKCLLAIECKYYTTHLGIELARNFEGLHADLRAQHELFVSNTSAPNVLRYLSARKREYEPLVAPSSPDRVQEVRSQIRRAFKSYLSGYTGSALI
ncbi:hypothetical protein ACFV1F_06545 [Streptomyces sp. NPDC059590]|uniref:hypothetical protein n=1 Tax=Streptomyces sp. NPDC059590 TaxID=3346877 RepID=UPI0036B992E9